MKFFLGLCILLLLITSCSALTWKRKYATKSVIAFQKKYFSNNGFEISLPGMEDTLDRTSFKKIKRKAFKRNVNLLEKGLALVPDSVFSQNVQIDSFYKNPNKIHFILKKKLKSSNIHFYE